MQATNTAGYDAPIGLTADPVVFTLLDGRLCVLLARRLEEPQRGMFALPGGFVGASEAPEQTAERKLREKTGVGSVHLEQLRTYADPSRDPRGWLPSIAYMALVRPETLPEERPADRDASWQPLDALPELALDHATIVDDGLWRLHARVADKVWFVRKALALLTEPFTLRQAQQLYEALRGEEVDAANFRRDVRATGLLEDTGSLRSEGPGPSGPPVPPRLDRSAKGPPRGRDSLWRALDPSRFRSLLLALPASSALAQPAPCPSTSAASGRHRAAASTAPARSARRTRPASARTRSSTTECPNDRTPRASTETGIDRREAAAPRASLRRLERHVRDTRPRTARSSGRRERITARLHGRAGADRLPRQARPGQRRGHRCVEATADDNAASTASSSGSAASSCSPIPRPRSAATSTRRR